MRKIILASQSPRRRELLTKMGVTFEVIPSNFDEKLDDSRSPQEVAIELALGKVTDVAKQYPDAIVIGSDTIVTIDGRQLEKPKDDDDARAMLKLLAGRPNDVTTSVVVVCLNDAVELASSDTSRVFFKPYDEQAVEAYLATGDHRDKAAAYGIQSGAATLIDHIEGEYDTIVGLPTKILAEFLRQLGIKAHAVHIEPPVRQVL